jgi:hypothetical protein
MYLFAHLFSGALIGLLFMRHIHDRRMVPVCILGALLPDLLDKPLAFLLPGIFGASRTLGHTLLFFFSLLFASGLILWHFRHTLLGVVFTFGVLSHQIFDSMWNLPASWYFPFQGPFPVILIPDYVRNSLWLEITSPSELIFALASIILIVSVYPEIGEKILPSHTATPNKIIRGGMASLLAGMGIILLAAGFNLSPIMFFAPAYSPQTSVMAGFVAFAGAIVLMIPWLRPVSE